MTKSAKWWVIAMSAIVMVAVADTWYAGLVAAGQAGPTEKVLYRLLYLGIGGLTMLALYQLFKRK